MDRTLFSSTLNWLTANGDRIALGALIAVGLVGLMLLMREVGHRLVRTDPDCRGWRGVIGRVLQKTTVAFMVAAALDMVASYTAVPTRIERLLDILFTIAFAF